MKTQTFEVLTAFVQHVPGYGMVVGNVGEEAAIPESVIAELHANGHIDATEWFDADEPHPLDLDGNGEPGGSEPHEPPALSGKNKAELLAIAESEGVTVADGATNAQIVEAIEAARTAAAEKAAEEAAAAGAPPV